LNNSTGKTAVGEIQDEMGGPIESRAPVYADHTVVNRADDIKASGIKAVVMVHGADDGTVGYNQTPEMFGRMVQEGIPTDFFTVTRHGDGPSGNTLEDTTTLSGRIPGYSSPFTGHGGENDPTHLVIRTGFDRLAALFLHGTTPDGFHEYVVDGG
jgi:hypothetical protein